VVMQSTARLDWTQRFSLKGESTVAVETKPS
jgi:hypothetical protein